MLVVVFVVVVFVVFNPSPQRVYVAAEVVAKRLKKIKKWSVV